jgi:hypothetical protein
MEEARRYNEGKLEWNLIDFKQLEAQVQVLMYGAHKYSVFEDAKGNIVTGAEVSPEAAKKLKLVSSGRDNWKTGLKIRACGDSFLRHFFAYMSGEDIDPESGLPHLGHMGCNLMFMSYVHNNIPELDDRPKGDKTE